MLKVNLPLQHLLAVLDTSHTSTLPTLSLLSYFILSFFRLLTLFFFTLTFPYLNTPLPLSTLLYSYSLSSLFILFLQIFSFLPYTLPTHILLTFLTLLPLVPTHSTLFRPILSLLTHTVLVYQFSFSPFSLLPTLFLSTFTPPTFTLLFLINLIHTTDTPSTLTLPTHILITLTLPISSFSQVSKC